MKCIYSKKTEIEATFNSREHIIPAGIGGRKQLQKGVVSDYANGSFSSIELDFMRNSHISIPRYFLGPGKRGSLSSVNGTESNVCIMFNTEEKDKPYLGYVTMGIPNSIPQFIIKEDGTSCFICSNQHLEDYKSQFSDFTNRLATYDHRYIYIQEKSLMNDFIFGYHKDKWYFSSSEESNYETAKKYIEAIKKNYFYQKTEPTEIISKVQVHQSLSFNVNNFERVCAKIVFNYLCHLKGAEFVLDNIFDPIRSWIMNGGENHFSSDFDPSQHHHLTEHFNIAYPEFSHKIIILNIGRHLVGMITFYGNHFTRMIKLCELKDNNSIYDVYICDWKNKIEYSLHDYLNMLNSQSI